MNLRGIVFAALIGGMLGSGIGVGANYITTAYAQVAVPPDPSPVIVQAPPAPTNVPSGGTILGGILLAVVTTYGGVLVAGLRGLISSKTGIQLSDRFDTAIQNGMTNAVGKIAASMDGKVPLQFKSEFVNQVVAYLQTTVPDLIKQMGATPTAGGFFDAVRARVEKFLLDPTFPVSIDATPAANPQLSGITGNVVADLHNVIQQVQQALDQMKRAQGT